MIGIYKITNMITGECYIGQSIDITTRWLQHQYAGTHNTRLDHLKLYQAMKKYGLDNFYLTVLEQLPENRLDERERYWIQYYDSYEHGYNSTLGGSGLNSQIFSSEEIRDLWDKGLALFEIADQLHCSVTTVGRRLKGYRNYHPTLSDCRTKLKRKSITYKINRKDFFGVSVYQYNLDGEFLQHFLSINAAAESCLGDKKYHNAIRHALKSESHYSSGFLWSKIKYSKLPKYDAHKVRSQNRGKKVRCLETGQIFNTITEASKWCNLTSNRTIGAHLSGKRKSAGKHPITHAALHWEEVL